MTTSNYQRAANRASVLASNDAAQVYATLAVADVLERVLLARSSKPNNVLTEIRSLAQLREITDILTEDPKRDVVRTLAAIEEVLGL